MKDIEKFLSEHIKSGNKTVSYNSSFPERPEKDMVIEWLENNSFELIRSKIGSSIQNREVRYYIPASGSDARKKIYNIGLFQGDGTDWVEFGNREYFFRLRLGDDFHRFLYVSDSYCSMRMEDLEKKKTIAFSDYEKFRREIEDKLV